MKRRVVRVEASVSLSLLFWLLQAYDDPGRSSGGSIGDGPAVVAAAVVAAHTAAVAGEVRA